MTAGDGGYGGAGTVLSGGGGGSYPGPAEGAGGGGAGAVGRIRINTLDTDSLAGAMSPALSTGPASVGPPPSRHPAE